MIKCKKCNTENAVGARFCKECGAAITKTSPLVWYYWVIFFWVMILAFSLQEFEQIADIFDVVGEYWSINEIL